jgi:ABC-type multidrug transport system fused ATPase/permease subunit
MAPAEQVSDKPKGGFGTLLRFLPMLWLPGETALKARVIGAVLLVLAGKATVLLMPFAYKAVIDRMSEGAAAFGIVAGLVLAYSGARFLGVFADNLRNALFERVGQNAARRLAGQVFRHIHQLSLRFHLERRTGSLTKVVERGTKSIDMMLYFLLFNIGPTVIELAAICVIFWIKSTTRRSGGPSIRCSITRRSNISAPRSARPSATTRRSASSRGQRNVTKPRSPGSISVSR